MFLCWLMQGFFLSPPPAIFPTTADSVVSTLVDLTHLKNYTESTDSALPLLAQR